MIVKEISPLEMKEWSEQGKEFQLIDVRESHEIDIVSLGGMHIPMAEVPERLAEIRRDLPIVVHCRSGARSAAICTFLSNSGFENVFNLKGGILAYAREVDPSLPTY
jgi:adenylyltransferase/sulfurtransferase